MATSSPSYQYPNALIKVVKASWRSRSKEELPSDLRLAELLNVTFQASLLSEESRALSFRIAYCTPEILQNDVRNRPRNRPLVFPIPRPLSVSELVRLAPAADPTQFLLGVHETPTGQLGIWGLIDAGLSWWEFARGERLRGFQGSRPPACFTVSTAQRGCITVSREGWVICALQRGVISRPAQQVFSSGPFGRYLKPMTGGMRHAYRSKLPETQRKLRSFDQSSAARFPLHFLERTLMRIAEARHGGTILIVPGTWGHYDTRMTDRLSIKYPLDDGVTWPLLVEYLVMRHQYYELFIPASKKSQVEKDEFHNIQHLNSNVLELEDLIRDRANLLASLTAVDGAVVITQELRLLGFGAEITAQAPTVKTIALAMTVDARHTQERSIEDFGTRHRSAIRFCASTEDVGAIVVSQDGDVRVILRVASDIVMWPSVGMPRVTT